MRYIANTRDAIKIFILSFSLKNLLTRFSDIESALNELEKIDADKLVRSANMQKIEDAAIRLRGKIVDLVFSDHTQIAIA